MTKRRFFKFGQLFLLGLLRFVILLTILGIITGLSTVWQLALLPTGIVLFIGRYILHLPQLRPINLVRSHVSPTWIGEDRPFAASRERAVVALRRPGRIPVLVIAAGILAALVPFALAQLGGICADSVAVSNSPRAGGYVGGQGPKAAVSLLQLVSFVLVEEFVFRGWLLFPLRKLIGAPAAVAITSYLFAVGHLRPDAGLSLLFTGIVFGTAVVLTGSIWSAVALHFAYNASLWAWDRFGGIFSGGAVDCATSRPVFAALASALFATLWIARRRRANSTETRSTAATR